jgi:hypothetical protein
VFRSLTWLARRLWSGRSAPGQDAPGQATAQYVTVRLPDGTSYAAGGEPGGPGGPGGSGRSGGSQQNPTLVIVPAAGGPQPPRRHWYSGIPRWLRWTVVIVILLAIFRRIAAWAALAVLSGALHLFGISASLPHVSFGWPWSSSGTTTSTTLVGPLVLQKIEGIDKPALGSTTFDFQFTHSVSKPIGILPCWYSATFSAVGHASATVDLNPGAAWWKPAAKHYVLKVLTKPSGTTPGRVSVTMSLPLPQLPQSVHDVSVDNTLSKPVSSDHSWTYPGLACGAIVKPQFTDTVLYAQAQQEAFTQATTVTSVTKPLVAAAEKEASTIIGGNFVTPTLNALNYKVSQFTINWVAPSAANG